MRSAMGEAKQLLCGPQIWDPQEAHTHT